MTNGGGATTRARLKLIRFATAGSLLIAVQLLVFDSFSVAGAQEGSPPMASVASDGLEGDPWEPFNEKMFWFNRMYSIAFF